MMTDAEFEIMDELYFIKSYSDLERVFAKENFRLEGELWMLILKGWVKVIDGSDQEIGIEQEQYLDQKYNLRFNATKQGLMAHNQV